MSTPIIPGQDHYWPPTPSPAVTPPPPRKPMLWWILGGAALIALAGLAAVAATLFVLRAGNTTAAGPAASTAPAQSELESRLTRTKSVCDAGDTGTRVADGGKTLIVDGAGDEDGGVGVDTDALECILVVLDTPESVKQHVYQTRALDGRQEDSWPGFTASWAYHPDSGIEMIVKAS